MKLDIEIPLETNAIEEADDRELVKETCSCTLEYKSVSDGQIGRTVIRCKLDAGHPNGWHQGTDPEGNKVQWCR